MPRNSELQGAAWHCAVAARGEGEPSWLHRGLWGEGRYGWVTGVTEERFFPSAPDSASWRLEPSACAGPVLLYSASRLLDRDRS